MHSISKNIQRIGICRFISGFLVLITLLSGFFLSSFRAVADDSVVDTITLSVAAACTLSGTGMNSHNATIANGTYASEIGSTTLKAVCNDPSGFAIYAIGFTDNIDGKNVLTSPALGASYDIATGAGTSGNSQWAMKLATTTSPTPAYPISIQNSYDSYHTVPSDYELVAKRTSATDVGDVAVGSVLTSTYQVFISSEQSAGTYVGQVKYVLLHPNNSEMPNGPKSTPGGYIGYYPNAGGTVADTMGDQAITASDTSAKLWASNFRRSGYGFAGWSDAYDYVVNVGSTSNPNAHIYGPIESAYFSAGQYSTNGLSLYAVWVPSAGSLQSWSGCNSLGDGDVTALTDLRDNNTYAVAKLVDGKCWMIENLRLDNTNSDNTTGTLAQGYGGVFAGLAQSESVPFTTGVNSLYYYNTQSGTATIDIGSSNYPQYRMPRFNNDNTAFPVSLMSSNTQNVYSYGNYYSWAAAMANTNYYNTTTTTNGFTPSESANTSICPSGWRLPYGRTSGKGDTPGGYSYLYDSVDDEDEYLEEYPNNFIYSGCGDLSSSSGLRGRTAAYWTSTARDQDDAYEFEWSYGDAEFDSVLKSSLFSVRCFFNN